MWRILETIEIEKYLSCKVLFTSNLYNALHNWTRIVEVSSNLLLYHHKIMFITLHFIFCHAPKRWTVGNIKPKSFWWLRESPYSATQVDEQLWDTQNLGFMLMTIVTTNKIRSTIWYKRHNSLYHFHIATSHYVNPPWLIIHSLIEQIVWFVSKLSKEWLSLIILIQ